MYRWIMARLDKLLSAFDKTKHHVVGTWVGSLVFCGQILAYFLIPYIPMARNTVQIVLLQLVMAVITFAVVWAVGLWNERKQRRLNEAAVAAGGVAVHEVSDADVRATVLGALPVLLPTFVLCGLQIWLLVKTS